MKSYTNIEQSKKLAEILPLESADMHYGNFSPKGLGYENKFSAGLTSYIKEIKVYEELKESYKIKDYNGIVAWRVIPCWSLTALLKYLSEIKPQVYTPVLFPSEGKWILQFAEYGHGNVCETTSENPIDACVAIIEKLNELNLL
jgi:hypothetical protein